MKQHSSKFHYIFRINLLHINHIKTSPALTNVWIEPVLTRASHVRVEILTAIRRSLASRSVTCSVQHYGRSPLLHVVHDRRERVYSFVQACEEFGSQVHSGYKSDIEYTHVSGRMIQIIFMTKINFYLFN